MRLARETASTDVFFARVHDLVPGFAGLLLDDGVPTVYLVDPTRAAAAEAVLMPFLTERGIVGRGFHAFENMTVTEDPNAMPCIM